MKRVNDFILKVTSENKPTIISKLFNESTKSRLSHTEQKFIPHCSTWLNQKRFLDYEDIKIEDIKKITPTKDKDKDNRPQWMRDKETLSKQNEARVSSSWSTEEQPKKAYKANPKASQKLAEIAAKHNL